MFGVCCGCCYRNYALVYTEIEEEDEGDSSKVQDSNGK